MRTIFLCLVTLMITTTVHGQALPPAPATRVLPQLTPLEEEPASARALFHVGGGGGFLTRETSSSGYQQLESARYNAPDTSWHLNAGAQFVATDWLRIGGELSYEFAGDTTEMIIRGEMEARSTRFHMGILDLTLTPYIRAGRLQLGLRFAGGFGFSRWVHNSRASGGGVYRASAAFDIFIPLSRRSSKGLNVRFGYQLRRTLPTGPIDLVFDHSSVFFNVAFMFGASS
ncbi:MAG: hypothetical protein ACI9KE_001614 [Polyangiales bacterium]|jgi:hypothetical protein